MALVQPVQDGKIVDNSASASASSTKSSRAAAKSQSGLDKEAFLQLLVAQMQYQDPLEPMDNTEYVAQLATFSQLEAIQNMSDTVNYGRANDLVGKYVILNATDPTTGKQTTVHGKVDYVMFENGDVFLAVNDGIYSIEDLDTVADGEYYEAVEMANLFSTVIANLPSVNNVTAGDAQAVEAARSVFDAMNAFQQGFVSKEDVEKLEALENRIKELTAASGSKPDSDESSEVNDG